jgi:Mrp family chromosome partitioning ATPase
MDNVSQGFDFLRISVEGRLSTPAVITVTSARSDDGASLVASGLADSFADAGQRTMLVSASSRPVGVINGNPNLAKTTAAKLVAENGGTPSALARGLQHLRAEYAVVVVDADALPSSPLAYELARKADGVVVAIRLGRKPGKEDRTTLQLLQNSGCNVLGIAPTGAANVSGSTKRLPKEAENDGFRNLALEVTR